MTENFCLTDRVDRKIDIFSTSGGVNQSGQFQDFTGFSVLMASLTVIGAAFVKIIEIHKELLGATEKCDEIDNEDKHK